MSNRLPNYTCPKIDSSIVQANSEVYSIIESMFQKINESYAGTTEGQAYLSEILKDAEEAIAIPFETVRELNTDLRSEAEYIIKELENELNEYR